MKLIGQKIVLISLKETYMSVCFRWVHDLEVTKYTRNQPPKTLNGEKKWFRKISKDPAERLFGIEIKESHRYIGNIGLHNINKTHRKCSLGILIGEKDCWNKGYGTDSIRTLLNYAFRKLGLHKISLTVDPQNERGIGCYKKCGFKKEGYLKDEDFVRGKWRDAILMAIINPYER